MSAISPATNSTAIPLRSLSFERQANSFRAHEGTFCTLPDLILKEILNKLPPSDPAALNLLRSQVSLFARSVYGVKRDDISQIMRFPAQQGEEPTSTQDFRNSILTLQNPNLAYKAQIIGVFVGQIEAIFETEIQVTPSEFHNILGRKIIKARYPASAENHFQIGYAQHLCLAFNLKQFLKTDSSPNLHAMLNLDGSILDRKQLNLHFNNQKDTVSDIRTCARIGETTLDLRSKILWAYDLNAVPPHIGQLVNLTELNLAMNKLTTLPAEIWRLINLTELHLNINQLTSLPAEIGKLENLKVLYLSQNKFTTLPVEIVKLQALTLLNLSQNRLTTLPAEIGQLVNLTELYLAENKLSTLPAEIGQLASLKELYLYQNMLTSLPVEIGELKSIVTLDLSYNRLTSLPAEIGKLANLTLLNLSSNQFTSLPTEIGKLANLRNLCLGDNQFIQNKSFLELLASLTRRQIDCIGALGLYWTEECKTNGGSTLQTINPALLHVDRHAPMPRQQENSQKLDGGESLLTLLSLQAQ